MQKDTKHRRNLLVIRIMHVLCTCNNCLAKDNFAVMMIEMDNKLKVLNYYLLLSVNVVLLIFEHRRYMLQIQ